ncbi:MAG: FAD:protein FMN transferase, partial [Geminicoccaceae bacterium]
MKRRTLLTGSLVACSGIALGSALLTRREHDHLVTVTGQTMGTYYRLRVPADSLPPKALRETAEGVLDGVVARMSTYRSESELSRFNHQSTASWTTTSEQTLAVIAKALEVSRLTEGAFDPTI